MFEYDVQEYPFPNEQLAKQLSAQGHEGWKLVTMMPVQKYIPAKLAGQQDQVALFVLCTFKREVLPECPE